jgi:mannose-6-phosphate isomerase-like protein (cupin superfamily)
MALATRYASLDMLSTRVVSRKEDHDMLRILLAALTTSLALWAADPKTTSATYITNTDVQSTLKRMPPDKVTDQQVRVVNTGKQNVGIGVVHRSAQAAQNAVEHDQVTEVYHILAGSGTMVTGGSLLSPQRRPSNDPALHELTGPSVTGSALQKGESRRVGPGDIIIIPAGVGHWFSVVDGAIDYVVVRIDPDKVVQVK